MEHRDLAKVGVAGTIEGIHLATAMGGATEPRRSARALAGRGLEGDRYASGAGFYSAVPARPGARQLTLIAGEALDDLFARTGIRLEPGEQRRNLVTRGVDLNALVGVPFRIGEVSCLGVALCEPCARLVELTGKEVLEPLVHRGGLRAAILTDGTIRVGDEIAPSEPSSPQA